MVEPKAIGNDEFLKKWLNEAKGFVKRLPEK